ncbi:helix-turn-helix transcriptional regulator [Listeria rocourtiae]|uniref:helix-turn-helix domain-containing protein n=1 Tax=Listeria rocourtiae TaxID=647910 RepID=UPI001625DFE1|nr:helix-turn-helix transcriptional regulator [Listeria rocourtiae]MBC1433775.1 helix-turn-helix transcriptional regulator [Listeria rocourtiae]
MITFERIKKLCKARGISLQDLARSVNIGENSIYAWKTNAPTSDKLRAVADYLDVSVDYLLGRSDNSTPEKGHSPDIQDIIDYMEQNKDFAESIRHLIQTVENHKKDN